LRLPSRNAEIARSHQADSRIDLRGILRGQGGTLARKMTTAGGRRSVALDVGQHGRDERPRLKALLLLRLTLGDRLRNSPLSISAPGTGPPESGPATHSAIGGEISEIPARPAGDGV
jgi:hypothetical protein